MVDYPSRGRERPIPLRRSGRFRWVWLFWLAVPILVFLAFQALPLEGVWQSITRLRGWQLILLATLNLAVLGFITLRWWVILRVFGVRVRFATLLGYRLAGFGVNYFTPGPQFGGEPLQVHLLQKRQSLSASTAVASVMFDKMLELFANLTFLFVGLFAALMSGMLAIQVPALVWVVLPLILLIPVLHLATLARGRQPLSSVLSGVHRLWPARFLKTWAERVQEVEAMIGAYCRERPRALVGLVVISGLVWAFSITEFMLLINFLGAPAGLGKTIGILTAARLAFVMPVPGGLGTLEASQFLAMSAAGFDPAIGLAASLIIRARDMSLGLVGLAIGGFNSR